MTSSQFVFIKLCATAVSAIGSWAITLGLFAAWAALEVSPLNSHPSVIRALWAQATPRTTVISFFVLSGFVAMTWRNIVSGFWPTLLGRKRLSTSIGFGFLAAYCLIGLIGVWIYKHPAYHPNFKIVLPWVVGVMIGSKLLVSVWLSLTLKKRGLITPKTIKSLALSWFLIATCIFGGVSLVATPTWGLAAAIVMMLPFASLAAAPLALQWNRHR